METIRLLSCSFANDAVEIEARTDDGADRSFRLPMPDFMIATRKIQEEIIALQSKESPAPPAQPAPLSVVHPKSITIQQEALTGDPVLVFDLLALGRFPIQVPQNSLPSLLQALAAFLSQGQEPQMPN